MVYGELMRRLRRAARSGGRLHLEPAHVRALLDPRAYGTLSALEAEELNSLCGQDNQPLVKAERVHTAINSVPIGSGIDPIATIGRSAGIQQEMTDEAVGLAASRLASAAVMKVSPRRRRATL